MSDPSTPSQRPPEEAGFEPEEVPEQSLQEKAQEKVQQVQEVAAKTKLAAAVSAKVAALALNPYSLVAMAAVAVIIAFTLQGMSVSQVLGRNPNVCKTSAECELLKCSSGGDSPISFSGAVGTPTVKGARMSAHQTEMAKKIISTGKSGGVPDFGIVIAIAVAIQESTLKNIDYGHGSSLGLFQQIQTGWGTAEDRRDPVRASKAFFGISDHASAPGLLDVAGWENMSLVEAAHAVQRSAFPEAVGQWEDEARHIFSTIGGVSTSTASCSGMAGGVAMDATGIVGIAREIAWPDGRRVGEGLGKNESTPAYRTYKQKAGELGGHDTYLGGNLYSSCDRFVATVMRNAVDPQYPWGPTSTQAAYLASSPKWAKRTGALQPGDVLVVGGSGGTGHTLIYLGEGEVAQASYFNYTARVTREGWAPSANGNYAQPYGTPRTYYAYYPTAGGGAA